MGVSSSSVSVSSSQKKVSRTLCRAISSAVEKEFALISFKTPATLFAIVFCARGTKRVPRDSYLATLRDTRVSAHLFLGIFQPHIIYQIVAYGLLFQKMKQKNIRRKIIFIMLWYYTQNVINTRCAFFAEPVTYIYIW